MLTAEYLRERLNYDPQTGVFTWRAVPAVDRHTRRWNAKHAGKVAGTVNARDGYRRISIDKEFFLAQRLAWFYVTGEWPDPYADHENRCRDDNRFANLREATRAQNAMNMSSPSHNTSGAKGVHLLRGTKTWQAQIKLKGKQIVLGKFRTFDKAKAAYDAAAVRYFGEFATDGVAA